MRPLLLLLILFQFASCVPYTQLVNFRKTEEFKPLEDHPVENMVRITAQPDDILFIRVHAEDPLTAAPYNLISGNQGANLTEQNAALAGYLIDPEGNIDFPVLGRLHIGGMTTTEIRDMLTERLQTHLKDAVVNVRFINFKITVLGEVNNPSTFGVSGERITILEAIGLAGDFTPYSDRDNVMVIREKDGERNFGLLDLRSPDVFKSPYFYLRQNDIVYVDPIKAKTATVRDPISEVLPIVSGILSMGALIIALAR